MKNKLYAFLGKRKKVINVLGVAAWLCFIFNLQTNKPVAIAGAVFMFVYICVSHAKALKFFMDERNSSSPHWDGHVRSHADLEPRLKWLRDRIAQDQAELDWIVAQSQTHE